MAYLEEDDDDAEWSDVAAETEHLDFLHEHGRTCGQELNQHDDRAVRNNSELIHAMSVLVGRKDQGLEVACETR